MIESLLATFARSLAWSLGKQASWRIVRRMGWMLWALIIGIVVVVLINKYGWSNVWINYLLSWLRLSAGLLPMSLPLSVASFSF